MFANLCSFCYNCGKEFDFFKLQFHQCPIETENELIDLTKEILAIDKTADNETDHGSEQSDLNKTLSESETTKTKQLLPKSKAAIACIDLTDDATESLEDLVEDVVIPKDATDSSDDVDMAYDELNEVIKQINDAEASFDGATVNLEKKNDETNSVLPKISSASLCPENVDLSADDKSLDDAELSADKNDDQYSSADKTDVAHARTEAIIKNVNMEVPEATTREESNGEPSNAPAQMVDDPSLSQSSSKVEAIGTSTLRGTEEETTICLRSDQNLMEKLKSSTAHQEAAKQLQPKESIAVEATSATEQQLGNNHKENKENGNFNSDTSSTDNMLKSTVEFFKYCESIKDSIKLENRVDDKNMESAAKASAIIETKPQLANNDKENTSEGMLKSTQDFFKYCEDLNKSTKSIDDKKIESTEHEKEHVDVADSIKIPENSVDNDSSAQESINETKSNNESNSIAKNDKVSTHTEKNKSSEETPSKQIEQLNERTKEHEERINTPRDNTDTVAINNGEATKGNATLVAKDLNLKPLLTKAVDVHDSSSDKNHRKYKENKAAKSKRKMKKKHNVSNLNENKDKEKAVNKDDNLKKPMSTLKDCDIFSAVNVSDQKTNSESKESHKKIKKTITIDQYKQQRLSTARKAIDESDNATLKAPERRLSSTEPTTVAPAAGMNEHKRQRLSATRKTIDENCQRNDKAPERRLSTPAAGFSHKEMEIIHEMNQWLSVYQLEGNNSDAARFSDDPDTDGENDQGTTTSIFCEACGLKTPNRKSLTNHMKEIHRGFTFKCFVCDMACDSLDALINHVSKYAQSVLVRAESQFLRQRKSGPNQSYPYYCGSCGTGFTLIQLTMIHKKDCKRTSKKKITEITKSTDLVKEFVVDTPAQEVRSAESASSNFLEYCEICGEKHKTLADKQKHLHLEKFQCLICRQHFEDLTMLATHYDLCHPKHDVINHEKTEYSIQKDFKYFCKFCGNKYYFISDLLSHKEVFHYDVLHGKTLEDKKNEDPPLTLEKIFEKPEKIPGLDDVAVESPTKADEVDQQEKNVSTDVVDTFDVDSNADTVIVDDDSSEPLQKDSSEVFVDVHEYLEKQLNNINTNVNDKLLETISLYSSEDDRWDEAANQLANVLSDEALLDNFDESSGELQILSPSYTPPLDDQKQKFCEACGYECYNHEALRVHSIKNHDGFRCTLCGLLCKDIAALIQHQDQHPLNPLQYAEEHSYSRWLNDGKAGCYRYFCNTCGQGYKYITEMKIHKSSTCPAAPQASVSVEPKEVEEPSTKSKKKKIVCCYCHQDFDYWHLLNEHRVKGCAAAQAASLTSCSVPTKAVVDNQIKSVSDSTNDNKSSTSGDKPKRQRKPTLQLYVPKMLLKKQRRTIRCPVCPRKKFHTEEALQQHSENAPKHQIYLKAKEIGEPSTPKTSKPDRPKKSPPVSRIQTSLRKKWKNSHKRGRSRSRSAERDRKRRRSNDRSSHNSVSRKDDKNRSRQRDKATGEILDGINDRSSHNSVSRKDDKNRSRQRDKATGEILDGIYSIEGAKKLCS